MSSIWSAIDISDNLSRCLRVVRRAHSLQALFLSILVSFMLIAATSLAWTFDITTTLDATSTLVERVNSQLPPQYIQFAALVVLSLTLGSTLFELVGAMFAKEGSTPFQGVVIALSIFDMWTDAPGVTSFLNANWSFFERFGMFTYPLYWVSWAIWLFCASFFFEMIAICLFVSLIGLLLRVFSSQTAQKSEA